MDIEMISIEKVSNGYVVRIEENGEDETLVCQKEYDSMNVALLAVFNEMKSRWHEDEGPQLKLDFTGG